MSSSGRRGVLRYASGTAVPGDRWVGEATEADQRVLDRCKGPVLDVGCGPARHTVALAGQGVPTLGIDITPSALAMAQPRDATVLLRDVFGRVPAAGRWGTVLLLDGNLGIGGDASVLLQRSRDLLRPGGKILAELADEGCGTRSAAAVRLELDDRHGPWFAWTTVGPRRLHQSVGATGGLRTVETWCDDGRWFVELVRNADE